MSVNILTLHSGAASTDASYTGAWTYWDDYQSIALPSGADFEDASCVGSDGTNQFYFVSPRNPGGQVNKITDGSPPTISTYTKASFGGLGSDIAYDAVNNKLYVLWASGGLTDVTITKMDVATWTEDATTTFTGYAGGSKPSICIHPDGTRLYVLTYGGADATPTQLLKITGLTSFGSATVAEALQFYVGNRTNGHCVRIDPTDTTQLYCSGINSWRARVDISGSMVKVWESTQLPRVLAPNSTILVFHDDIGFGDNHIYLIGGATSGTSLYPPGGIKVSKANGQIVDAYYDSSVYQGVLDGVGVDVNRTTREIMATQGRGLGLPVWSLDDHKMRQRNAPAGANPDDCYWSQDGTFIWSVPLATYYATGRPTSVTRWSKIDGPIGVGRIKAQLNAAASFTVGSAHAGTNTGVYAGVSFQLADLAYTIDHCTLVTLTTDGTTGTWQCRLQVIKSTGAIQLMFPDGSRYDASQSSATGWHFVELRYDKATTRYRVYLDNGSCILDITKGSGFDAGQTVFGPWDASGSDTQTVGIHTAYDIQLDDGDYDGSRWGEISACYVLMSGANTSYQQWAQVGAFTLNHANAISDVPDFLTPAHAADDDTTYIQSDGTSVTDQWDIFTQQRYTQQLTPRAMRIGVRAKVVSGAGSFSIGWNGEGSGDPGGTWTLRTITPSGGYAYYSASFYKNPDGTFPLASNSNGYWGIKQAASAGVNVRITQAIVSLIGSTQPALSFTSSRVTDTTALDLTYRGFAAPAVFTAISQETADLDITSRGFSAQDIIARQSITVVVGQIIVTGEVATISADVTVNPTVAAITVTGEAATVAVGGVSVTATLATIAVTGEVATAVGAVSVTATVAAITVDGAVATGLISQVALGSVADISFVGGVATATNSGNPQSVTITAAAINLTGEIATVSNAVSVTITRAALSLTGGVATATGAVSVTASVGVITVVGEVATAAVAGTALATAAQITVTGEVATFVGSGAGPQIASATVGVIALTGEIATVSVGDTTVVATVGVIVVAGEVATAVVATPLTAAFVVGSIRFIGSVAVHVSALPLTKFNASYTPVSLKTARYEPTGAFNAENKPETQLVGRNG